MQAFFKKQVQTKHLKHFIKSMRGHIHALKRNINTKYLYMYKLWQRQIEAYRVVSKKMLIHKKHEENFFNLSSQCVVYQREMDQT